ncbi:MAG TPA: class II aldolase/adducin family protein [Solirubrobacteraceae bacterium]|nr:class II aldolase/adducin family protein [Solirubrobacteraceae bacterium]
MEGGEHGRRRMQMVEAGSVLDRSGVMSHTGHINFSTRIDERRMMLTSSGLIAELRPEALAVVDFDGNVEEGRLNPSTIEIVGMHAAVYRLRADVGAVLHTHSPHVTAFALANEPLPCRYEALLRRGQPGAVPVVGWAPRGSQEFFDGIAATLATASETSALLLGNHGVLAFGSSALAAVKLLIVLEEAAEAELRAAAIGGAKDLRSAG